MPKPAMMRPNTRPIMPVPITPTVLPCRSKPSNPLSEKSPSRVRAAARGKRRFSARISPTACSATACGEYAGTRTTGMPSRCAAARST